MLPLDKAIRAYYKATQEFSSAPPKPVAYLCEPLVGTSKGSGWILAARHGAVAVVYNNNNVELLIKDKKKS